MTWINTVFGSVIGCVTAGQRNIFQNKMKGFVCKWKETILQGQKEIFCKQTGKVFVLFFCLFWKLGQLDPQLVNGLKTGHSTLCLVNRVSNLASKPAVSGQPMGWGR